MDKIDSRKRQSKRDDAIRRKIENDLNKKKKNNIRTSRNKKGAPGTVLSLKPLEPIVCKPSKSIYEVAQIMAAKRENCVLVVNDEGELLGIFTAKDLAFRIVGSGLNANNVTVDQIMTPNPMCAQASTPAAEALTLMVQKGFRHLPVLDENNSIVGVLDITKCYAQQMEKLDRMYQSSKKLYEALDNVNMEIGGSRHPAHIFQYFESLKSKMDGPIVKNVLNSSTVPIYISVRASVYEATVLMKENRTTAVLVKDTKDEVAGIFTSKDVVLRVIAAGLDPNKCSIVRVMTPQPDVADDEMPIQHALKQMLEGHYLNLPIVNQQSEIVGIVDVLKLTYSILSHIRQVEANGKDGEESRISNSGSETAVDPEGPAWNKFWTSLDNDTDSNHSDSLLNIVPEVTQSEFQSFNIDIRPSDSISHCESPVKSSNFTARGTDTTFSFKFKSPAFEGRVHRITLKYTDGVEKLKEMINNKLLGADYEALGIEKDGRDYAISYIDDEGDIVSITTDSDLVDCAKVNLQLKNERADLFIHNHTKHPNIDERKMKRHSKKSEGIPMEYILPGAIMILASAAIIGFALSRK